MRQAALIATAAALLVAGVVGFYFRYEVLPVVPEADARQVLETRSARWLAEGYVPLQAQPGALFGRIDVPADHCAVVVAVRWGRILPRHAFEQTVVCYTEPDTIMPSRVHPTRTGVLFGGSQGVASRAFAAPFTDARNPLTMPNFRASGVESRANMGPHGANTTRVYTQRHLDAFLASREQQGEGAAPMLLGPAPLSETRFAHVIPGSRDSFRELRIARGVYPGARGFPRAQRVEVPRENRTEGFVPRRVGDVSGAMTVESRVAPRVPGRTHATRVIAVIDPAAFRTPCVDVRLLPRNSAAGALLILATRPRIAAHDAMVAEGQFLLGSFCAEDGPVLLTGDSGGDIDVMITGADARSAFVWDSVPEAVQTERDAHAQRLTCVAEPTAAGCVETLRELIHGPTGPLLPRAALEPVRTLCDSGDEQGCMLWIGSVIGLDGTEPHAAALEKLNALCDAGHAPALRLRAEMRRIGFLVARDYAMARVDYEAACAAGDEAACTEDDNLPGP